jgi:hypothetical protein
MKNAQENALETRTVLRLSTIRRLLSTLNWARRYVCFTSVGDTIIFIQAQTTGDRSSTSRNGPTNQIFRHSFNHSYFTTRGVIRMPPTLPRVPECPFRSTRHLGFTALSRVPSLPPATLAVYMAFAGSTFDRRGIGGERVRGRTWSW